MKLIFYIDYRTNWGESVYLTGPVALNLAAATCQRQ